MEIITVSRPGEELEQVKALFHEYVTALNVDLSFQHFSKEFNDPLVKYGTATGCLLLARDCSQPAGCIALQQLAEPGVCEMKRLYTKPQYRGRGIGNTLIEALISHAREMGYKKMVLDTLASLVPAIRLYQLNGFKQTTAYYHNPLEGVMYMERNL